MPQHLVEEEVGRTPTKRLSKPEDISNVVVFLASQANGHVNGELIRVTGGHNG
ncbi:MAG TPA: SDR family oxidoreductase [Bacillales bacterium]|nr:SDR family oxidoreductase [Bacillales bacterium]